MAHVMGEHPETDYLYTLLLLLLQIMNRQDFGP